MPDQDSSALAAVTVRSPAKINLHLGVGAPREDGFHPLDTVYQAIGLTEKVSALPGPLQLSSEFAEYVDADALPTGLDNIMFRAARLLSRHHAREISAQLRLCKEIPIAGGLAGGSSDGAATLLALDALHQLNTPTSELLALAAELGSDVPFLLVGGTALGGGRGEEVTPVADSTCWHWVVVPSSTGGLSTPAVYRQFDKLFPSISSVPASSGPLREALESADPRRLADALHNDLQPAAIDLRPDLDELIGQGEREGALRGLVSGSGPTVIFLCADVDSQREVARALGSTYSTVLCADGPVEGARVVAGP